MIGALFSVFIILGVCMVVSWATGIYYNHLYWNYIKYKYPAKWKKFIYNSINIRGYSIKPKYIFYVFYSKEENPILKYYAKKAKCGFKYGFFSLISILILMIIITILAAIQGKLV
jgi:multisubunit Na+/H+ antiporter MnhB subunit